MNLRILFINEVALRGQSLSKEIDAVLNTPVFQYPDLKQCLYSLKDMQQ